MPITVGETLKAPDRAAWREWLATHHAEQREVWLIADDRPDVPTVDYLDAVEEALCFGWIGSAGGWEFFAATPPLYQRVRAGYVEEQRRVPDEFAKRLNSLIEKCVAGKMFGGWNDGGRLQGDAASG